MTDDLKTRLAVALNIDPAAIQTYSPDPAGGYTIILTNYQKFTAVHPTDPHPTSDIRHPTTVNSAILGSEAAEIPQSAIEIPEDLKLAYLKPHRVDRNQLRKLADLLGITYTAKTRKTQLVTKINTWKQDHES